MIPFTFIAAVLYTFFEWLRIKFSWGKVSNINHVLSLLIALICFAAMLIIFKQPLFTWQTFWYGLYFASVRGMIYDPLLNIFCGRYIDYEGTTSNNKTDNLERILKLDFVEQRVWYSIAAFTTYVMFTLYER